nr:hypothetical protein [Phycisphaeraceae bacterium]
MNDASLLITKRLVGDATPQEIAQLSGWINASPRNARQYAEEVYLFRSIRDKYAGETAVDSVCSLQTPRQAAYRLVADRPRFSAAAMVLLAAMLGLWAVSELPAQPGPGRAAPRRFLVPAAISPSTTVGAAASTW